MRCFCADSLDSSQPEGYVAGDGEMGEQCIVLKQEADIAPLRRHERAVAGNQPPADLDRTAGWQLQPRRQPQDRGLATARRTEQAEDLFFAHLQRHVMQNLLAAIGMIDAGEDEGGHLDTQSARPGRERRIVRQSRITGISPTPTIISAGVAAPSNRSVVAN